MSSLYPTVNNSGVDFGLAFYDIRDNQIYASINNKDDEYGLPLF